MGDRSNIVMKDETGAEVWFYTHWRGYHCPEILQTALRRAKADDRLNDEPYLGRIVFCAMIEGSGPKETTGFGISSRRSDWEYPALFVDIAEQQVRIVSMSHHGSDDEQIGAPIPFEEYMAIDDIDYDALTNRAAA